MNISLQLIECGGVKVFIPYAEKKSPTDIYLDSFCASVSENNGGHEPMCMVMSHEKWSDEIKKEAKKKAIELAEKDPNFKH